MPMDQPAAALQMLKLGPAFNMEWLRKAEKLSSLKKRSMAKKHSVSMDSNAGAEFLRLSLRIVLLRLTSHSQLLLSQEYTESMSLDCGEVAS